MAIGKSTYGIGLLGHLYHYSLLLGSILWMVRPEGRASLKLSEVQVALLAALLFCVFFSYLPNEGLIVRQRVQAVPALLALCGSAALATKGLSA